MPMFEAIVVTGEPFSGKTSLAQALAQEFGWKYFSAGDLWRELWKKKYPRGDESFENFMADTTDEENRQIDRQVGDIIKQGHIVVDARFGFLYRDPQTLIVFTQCDIDERAKRALEKKEYPTDDFARVKEILEQEERDEVDRCQALYQTDFRDSKNYDLLFDTTNSAPDEAIAKILEIK